MRFSLLIKAIAIMFLGYSCHRAPEAEIKSPSEAAIHLTNEAGEINISREQFESMNMAIGDPATWLFSSTVHANGYVEASPTGSAKISALIPGQVKQINFFTGDYVKSGQTLFVLESYESILLQQNYAEAFHRLKLLKADYERLQVLWDEKIASQKDFLKAESEYWSGHAEAEGLKARLKMIHIDPVVIEKGNIVPYLPVKSPIAGTLSHQELVLGQQVVPDETCVEIVNVEKLRLRLELFEKSIPDLAVGQQVSFSTPDRPERTYAATLTHIGKSVSLESRTVDCYAKILEEDKTAFVNNMFVESTITTWEREALAIPEQALIKDHERDYVLILIEEKNNEMTFRQIPVKKGATRQGHTEILDENLTSVLIEGVYSLWSGE